MENIRSRELMLMKRFYEGVKEIPGVRVYGDFSEEKLFSRAPVVALNIRDYDSGEVADELAAEYGIYTRPTVHPSCIRLWNCRAGSSPLFYVPL